LIHRNLRYMTGWEWHVLQLKHISVATQRRQQQSSTRSIAASLQESDERYMNEKQELIQAYPEAAVWINDSYERFTNNILIKKIDGYGSVVQGTIIVQLSKDVTDTTPFHFWLSETKLLTMHRDARISLRLQQFHLLEDYERCSNAPEAFFLMLGTLLESIHIGLDQFEERLGELERDMKDRNRKDLLEIIIERRYDLLHYSHLYLPIRELEGLAKEAFLELLTASEGYSRIQYRLQRIDHLLKHYAIEIDTLISVDDALSNFRGNEIIRTLTIFTAICLPATIIGAIWGTNFIDLPFKQEPLGFLYMVGAILILTGFIYFLLWRKGWTGDILDTHSKRKNIKQHKLNEMILDKQAMEEQQALPSRKHRGKQKLQREVKQEQVVDGPLPSRKRK